jgi:hypothetical protein
VCVREPEVPVRTAVTVVTAALLAAVRTTVCGLLALTVYVGAEAVTPVGKPESCTETLDENPLSAVRLITV